MPGNRAIFDRAIEGNRAAAEREDWLQAMKEALRAVQEFPSDLDARSSLAIALYHNEKYAQAVHLLEELRKRRGDDPFTLAYLARAYQGTNQLDRAVAIMLELAASALQQRRFPDAIEALEEAVRLEPGREDLRLQAGRGVCGGR